MAFMLISHGVGHLRLASDDGHLFLFEVVSNKGARLVNMGRVEWTAGRQPANSAQFIEHASHFAWACAQDVGLL
jgi:hypothetical protein